LFFGTNTSQRDFPKMTGHFSVQIHPSTILLGHFSVQIHPSTIFLFFTTLGALSFDRHKTSLECTRSSQDGAGQHAGDRGRIEQRAVRCSTRPSAGSLQPGNRSIGPAWTARCSTPGSSQGRRGAAHRAAADGKKACHGERACARTHARSWHNWNSLDVLHVLHALQHPAVRGHFSTPQQCTRTPAWSHLHACARAHTHYWHNWSDAMIDCRRVNRLRTGWCCCLCFCCQSDRDCKTCREAEDRC